MNSIGRILNLLRKETPSPGTDYTGTVTKVEGGVAYVQLAGADINDTPVKMSVNAKKGDTVRVRVNKGRAWLVGNDTAPPTDDTYAKESEVILSNEIKKTNGTVKTVEGVATEAHKIAGNTDQYFWHVTSGTDTGAHLTEIPQDQFLEDPENGGGNLLARSNGIAIRDGLTELAQFGTTVVLGHESGSHAEISPNGMSIYNENPSLCLDVGASETTVEVPITTTYSGGAYIVRSDSNTDLTMSNKSWNKIPTDTTGTTLNRIQIKYEIRATNRAETQAYTITGNKWLTEANSYTASVTREFTGDGVSRTLTVTYNKQTKTFSATVNASIRLLVECVKYEMLKTANAPSFMYGSLASGGSVGGFSAAMGANLNAAGDYQLVTGKWNANDSNNLFEIGNGTGDTNRSTAFSVDDEGNVLAAGDYKAAGERLDYDFISVNSPFQLLYCHARRFGGMIHLSMEIFISSAFVANYRYTVGTIASDYVPRDIEVGTGHSTDSSYNPAGLVTWIVNTNGDLQISLQSTAGAYAFLQSFYPYR